MADTDDRNSNKGLFEIQAVAEDLPSDFETLRREALAEGHGFIEKLAADWISRTNRFDREGEALIAVNVNGEFAGIGGLTIDPAIPLTLRMRRFYVRPPHRRSGIGRHLAMTLIGMARRSGRPVTVNAATGSIQFWESLGFKPDARAGHTHTLRWNDAFNFLKRDNGPVLSIDEINEITAQSWAGER
jgi:GNAT superfamily N-acetyltransferase